MIDICVRVCYLPPQYSTRHIDVHNFYENLICQVHNYQSDTSLMYICDDFNGRCSDNLDFIPGTDNIPKRDVVVYTLT